MSSINPNIVNQYGHYGEGILNDVNKTLESSGLKLTYNKTNDEYKINNSNGLSKESIMNIFRDTVFRGLCPLLKERTDKNSDYALSLMTIEAAKKGEGDKIGSIVGKTRSVIADPVKREGARIDQGTRCAPLEDPFKGMSADEILRQMRAVQDDENKTL